jgi:hypothetical protein
MTMRKRVGSVLITLSAAALAVGMSASSAMAATTLKVKVTNGGSYTATAAKTVLTDNGIKVTCVSTTTTPASKATGRIPTGTHIATSPVKVGTVATLNFKHCTGPLGSVATTVRALPYSVKVDSTTTSTGKTDGMITGIVVKVSTGPCSFVVKGRSPGYYDNATHKLHMTKRSGLPKTPLNSARLTVTSTNGQCLGAVNVHDHPTYVGTYKLSRAIKVHSSRP